MKLTQTRHSYVRKILLSNYFNTRVYNLIFVLQITRLSSKTDPRNGSKKEKRNYDKVRNNKTMLKIRILYHKI